MRLALLALIYGLTAHASEAPGSLPSGCFDLSRPVSQPLRAPIELGKDGVDASTKGQFTEKKGGWAAARGRVQKPLKVIYEAILNPYTIKDPKKSKVEVKKEERPGFLAFRKFKMTIKPIPFVSLSWTEDWAFVAAETKKEEVSKLIVSYQKSDGTDHINHLCGSIVLQRVAPDATDVFLYQEIDATHQSPEDLERSQSGTLATLRK